MKRINLDLRACAVAAVLFVSLPMMVLGEGSGVANKLLSIGPRATYSIPKDADEGNWSAGAQVRLHLTPGLGLEGSIDYRSNTYGSLTTIKTYPVQASVLAYLMPGSFISPFVLGGIGWYYTQVDGPVGYSNTSSRFGMHAGAGVELMLNDFVTLDGTYRYIWLENVASKSANALNKTYQDAGSMFTIALNFLF